MSIFSLEGSCRLLAGVFVDQHNVKGSNNSFLSETSRNDRSFAAATLRVGTVVVTASSIESTLAQRIGKKLDLIARYAWLVVDYACYPYVGISMMRDGQRERLTVEVG